MEEIMICGQLQKKYCKRHTLEAIRMFYHLTLLALEMVLLSSSVFSIAPSE